MTDGTDREVCIVGLGYVGLTLAVAFASEGIRVRGVDVSHAVVENLTRGRTTFHEIDLADRTSQVVSAGHLTASLDLPVSSCYVVCVGTPRNAHGSIDDRALSAVIDDIAGTAPEGALVIVRSTVAVGTTRRIAARVADIGRADLLWAMCPERTLEGAALKELSTLPQIVGAIGPLAAERASSLFATLGVQIVRASSPEVAELAKLSLNAHRDASFALANALSLLASSVGVDPNELFSVARHEYPRAVIARPGPVGGPCLTKDPGFLSDIDPDSPEGAIFALARRINRSVVDRAAAHVRSLLDHRSPSDRTVAVLGCAFKGNPETSDLRDSPALDLVAALSGTAASVVLADPVIGATELSVACPGTSVTATDDPAAAISGTAVVVIANDHQRWRGADFHEVLSRSSADEVIDLWNMVDLSSHGYVRSVAPLGTHWRRMAEDR
jgi:UDP-N-acetyl-D-mannosaminuronic acid dehydrogenase